jgi:hypothetical protein
VKSFACFFILYLRISYLWICAAQAEPLQKVRKRDLEVIGGMLIFAAVHAGGSVFVGV